MGCPPSPAGATAPPVTNPKAPPAAGAEGAKSSSALVVEEGDPAAAGAPLDMGWEGDTGVDPQDQRASLEGEAVEDTQAVAWEEATVVVLQDQRASL